MKYSGNLGMGSDTMKAIKTLAVLACTLTVGAALAQNPGGGSPRGGSVGPRGPALQGVAPEPMLMGASVTAQVRLQLVQLEEDLRLTSPQRAPWMKYANQVLKLVDDVVRTRTVERFPKGSALQQFELLGDTARNRLTAIEEIIDSGKSFYATLDPRQQELADRRLARLPLPLLNGNPPIVGPGYDPELPVAGPGSERPRAK